MIFFPSFDQIFLKRKWRKLRHSHHHPLSVFSSKMTLRDGWKRLCPIFSSLFSAYVLQNWTRNVFISDFYIIFIQARIWARTLLRLSCHDTFLRFRSIRISDVSRLVPNLIDFNSLLGIFYFFFNRDSCTIVHNSRGHAQNYTSAENKGKEEK